MKPEVLVRLTNLLKTVDDHALMIMTVLTMLGRGDAGVLDADNEGRGSGAFCWVVALDKRVGRWHREVWNQFLP